MPKLLDLTSPPIKKWSFSAIKRHEKCPFEIYLARVEKCPVPRSEDPKHPLVRGERIHKEAEDFVRDVGPMTKDLRKFEERLSVLGERYNGGHVEVEQNWGFDREWAQRTWFDKDCWAMVKCDLVDNQGNGIYHVVDYKTGKRFGNEVPHQQQLQLYAIATFLQHPDATLVKAAAWYTDEGTVAERTYLRPAILLLLPRWTERANKLTNAMAFPAKPNKGNCRYCDFGITNGNGRCPYAVGENTT